MLMTLRIDILSKNLKLKFIEINHSWMHSAVMGNSPYLRYCNSVDYLERNDCVIGLTPIDRFYCNDLNINLLLLLK